MEIFRSPMMNNQNGSEWKRIENYVKEQRPLQPMRKIVVKGAVDVIYRRSDNPALIVAGETADAVASVKTYFHGGKLVIEREGMTISFGNSRMTVQGTVMMSTVVNGQQMGSTHNQGKVVVGICLPEAPAIKIKGSGDVTLLELRQEGLELEIEGSGDITANGQVGLLTVEIAGSGDVDASELIADQGRLSIAGSGDIEAYIRIAVLARVAGSGDIVVRGNPPQREHSVAGSGKIKFR